MANWIDLARHGAAAWRTNYGIQVLPISAGAPISGIAEDDVLEKNSFQIARSADGTITEISFRSGAVLPGKKSALPSLVSVLKVFPGCQIRPMESVLVGIDIAKRTTAEFLPAAQWLWEVDLTDIRPDSVMLVPHDSDELPLRLFTTTQEAGLAYADAAQVKLAIRETEPRYFLQREPGGGYWAVSASAMRGMTPQRLARLRQESAPALRFAWNQTPGPFEQQVGAFTPVPDPTPIADEPESQGEPAVEGAERISGEMASSSDRTTPENVLAVEDGTGGEEQETSAPGDVDQRAERTSIEDFGQKIGGARKDAFAELTGWRQGATKEFQADIERMKGGGQGGDFEQIRKEFQHQKFKESLMPGIPLRTLRGMLEDGHDPMVLAFREFVRSKLPSRVVDMISDNWGWSKTRRSTHFNANTAIEAGVLVLRLCNDLDRVFLNPETTFSNMMENLTNDFLADEMHAAGRGSTTRADRDRYAEYLNDHHIGNGRTLGWVSRYESIFPALSYLLKSKSSSDRHVMGRRPVRLGDGAFNMLRVARGLADHIHGAGFDTHEQHRALFDIANYQLSLSRKEDPEEVAKGADAIAAFWAKFEQAVKAFGAGEQAIAVGAGIKASTSKPSAKRDADDDVGAGEGGEEEDDKAALPRRIFLLDGRNMPTPPRYVDLRRTGPDRHAETGTVTPETLAETFGFRAIEWGNWVTQPERAAILNLAYDSFGDMADALGVPPKFMGFHGRLAVSFGARGRGGHAAAHYESGLAVLHLTKTMGAGTVGHEWTHAVDHFLADRLGYGKFAFLTRAPKTALEATDIGKVVLRFMEAMKDRRVLEEASGLKVTAPVMDAYKHKTLLALEGLFDDEWLKSFQHYVASHAEKVEVEVPADAVGRVRSFLTEIGNRHVQQAENRQYVWPGLLQGLTFRSSFVGDSFFHLQNSPDDKAARVIADAIGDAMNGRRFVNMWKKHRNVYYDMANHNSRTVFMSNAGLLDAARDKPYWSSDVELLARGFSAVIHDRMADEGIVNDFATRYSAPGGFGEGYMVSPNPEGVEREAIALSATALLKEIRSIASAMEVEAATAVDAEAAPTVMLAG
jgi:hypothetical protein